MQGVEAGDSSRKRLKPGERKLQILQAMALMLEQESEKVTTASVLHDHQKMLARLEDLKQPDHIRMLYLLQKVDLLEDLALGEIVFHIAFLDGLDGDVFAGQFVNPERDLAEGAFPY